MNKIHGVLGICSLAAMLCAEPVVTEPVSYQAEGSAKRIYQGKVTLPSRGIWEVEDGIPDTILLVAPEEAYDQVTGRRLGEVLFQDRLNAGRTVQSIQWRCKNYAKEHDGAGPATLKELEEEPPFFSDYWKEAFTESPWDDLPRGREVEGPFFYLIPSVSFAFNEEGEISREERLPLAFELQPYVNDGKHWVCFTDGRTERVEIDPELLKRCGQEIHPVFETAPYLQDMPETFEYTIYTVAPAQQRQVIGLENDYSDEQINLTLDWSKSKKGDESIAESLREMETYDWWRNQEVSDSPVLAYWLALADEEVNAENQGEGSETTSAMGVMGGYAAVRETLQMQLIGTTDDGVRDIAVETLDGVEVESHPYEEMLKGEPGGKLALAELAPADHLFIYFSNPEAMLPMLDDGADFLSELGGMVTGNRIKYFLKDRYLTRLGLNDEWLRNFLKSGAASECAVLAPDMFFIDGTDLTVVSRLSKPKTIAPLLSMLGVRIDSSAPMEMVTSGGKKVYWTMRDDLLIVSSRRAELDRVLALAENGGEGSLGKSAEFRYMLTQLPVHAQTRAYAYCSEPFIRKLVGPETKIGQLRRVAAIKTLTTLTAGALLAEHDGFGRGLSIEALNKKGFLPEGMNVDAAEYSLDEDGVAHSKTYGTLAGLASVDSVPVELVTTNEAKAYQEYMWDYSRYWREFFDPIALRLDDVEDGALEAEIFILPLVDSSIYNGMRESVAAREDGTPLRVPKFTPDPVFQFSVNLKEEAWTAVTEGLADVLNNLWDVDPAILDDLGPSVHLAMNDGDPIIALGSGDMLGAFGGSIYGMDEEMLFIPMFLSVLTRPSTIAVETENPEKTIMYLRHASESMGHSEGDWGDEIYSEIYQIEGRDEWVCLFDIMGVLKLRYGLEVKDGFLLIRNIPWSSKDRVEFVEASGLNGAQMKLWPSACDLQLPGLFATSAEQERMAALQGAGALYPLLASGRASMETVLDEHMKLFGFTPRKASDDEWFWHDGIVESQLYGSVSHKKQPAFDNEKGFGLFGVIEDISVQMQFEETGLRTAIKWRGRK